MSTGTNLQVVMVSQLAKQSMVIEHWLLVADENSYGVHDHYYYFLSVSKKQGKGMP